MSSSRLGHYRPYYGGLVAGGYEGVGTLYFHGSLSGGLAWVPPDRRLSIGVEGTLFAGYAEVANPSFVFGEPSSEPATERRPVGGGAATVFVRTRFGRGPAEP